MKCERVSMRSPATLISLVAGMVMVLAESLSCAGQTPEWAPVETLTGASDGARTGHALAMPVLITDTPKVTADVMQYTRVYLADLKKFNISRDATMAAETSIGINQALRDAQAAGANRIVFPPGTYLIHETNPVVVVNTNMVIDLNGSTFRINANGLPNYAIIKFEHGAENVRLTNGRLLGDKDSHDYETITSSHEWGCGLVFDGGINLEVDHMTLTNCTGDGVRSNAGIPFKEPKRCLNVAVKNLEHGAISKLGEKEPSEQKTRTIRPYEIPDEDFHGEFEFGYIYGYRSYPSVMDRNYQAYFYDRDMRFLQTKACIQFKRHSIPNGARFVHLEFNQPDVKEAARHGFCGSIVSSRPPVDVHFHDNILASNRRLGFGFCGGQRWVIENNRFEGNGGCAPGYGIDFEDGWDFMQDIVFRKNTFKGNRGGDLVVCAGSELIFEGNHFEKNVVVWGRTHNYSFRQNRFMGDTGFRTRTGVASIGSNVYDHCATLSVVFDPKGGNDGFVHKPGEPVKTSPLTFESEALCGIRKVVGTYFSFTDCKISNTCFVAGKDTRLIHFKNCEFSDASITYEANGPDVDVVLENCRGSVAETGPGIGRKKVKTAP